MMEGERISPASNKPFSFLRLSIYVVVCLVTVIFFLTFSLGFAKATVAVTGIFYVLFLPGFVLSWVFFSQGQLETIERILVSFALSTAAVPLVIFFMRLSGIKINFFTGSLAILMIIIPSLVLIYLQHKQGFKNGQTQ